MKRLMELVLLQEESTGYYCVEKGLVNIKQFLYVLPCAIRYLSMLYQKL